MFRFFTAGFAQTIFGAQYNPDGSLNYSFNFASDIGHIFIIVFIAAMIMFFINFLLTFRSNNPIDQNGSATSGQGARFAYLKWPIIMVLLLIGTPFILITIDTFITNILNMFNGTTPKKLTVSMISAFEQETVGNNSYFARVISSLTTEFTLGGHHSFHTYLLQMNSDILKMQSDLSAFPNNTELQK
jgi:hypothetical protein